MRPILGSTYRAQDIAGGGYQVGEINSLEVRVFDSSGTLVAQTTLAKADIYSLVTIASLAVGTYTVTCTAKDASGNAISIESSSTAQVTVTESSVTALDLRVQLMDKVEQTQSYTFAGITINSGNLITSGAVTISTSSAPVQLQAVFQSGGTLSTVATIVSVSGATVGTDYLLALDRRPGADMTDHYFLQWGSSLAHDLSDFVQNEIDLGSYWSGGQWSITGPSGTGTLTVQLGMVEPVGPFPLFQAVTVTAL